MPLRYPGLEPIAFLDPQRIDGIAALEASTADILDEFQALVERKAPELMKMSGHADDPFAVAEESGRWSSIPLIKDGVRVDEHADLCPVTMARYAALDPPAIVGRSPNLMFSLLDPKSRIPPHRGVSNTRAVLHLPLIVPDGCAIRVDDGIRQWRVGEALLFDDTFEHEVWNDSDQLRVILLGDLWRPELSGAERSAVAYLLERPAVPAETESAGAR